MNYLMLMVACSSWKTQSKVKSASFHIQINENSHIGLHIKKRRLELSLFQKDVAKIFGISEDALRFWENGLAIPNIRYAPAIILFLGYNPYPQKETETLGGKIRQYRLLNGLSYNRMGDMFGVDASTVSAWEKNKCLPNKPKLELLNKLLGCIM